MCLKPGEETLGQSAMGLPQRTVRGPLLVKLPASLMPKDFQVRLHHISLGGEGPT